MIRQYPAGQGLHWPTWRTIGFALLLLAGCIVIWSVASAELTPLQQSGLAVATGVIFLVANRRPGAMVTMFLVVLSGVVSLRYIVWRVTETLEFNSVLQGLFGTILALAETYAITVLALGYIQTICPLERKPVPLPEDPDDWPSVDVYIPTYNEDLRIVRASVLAALAIDWPMEKLNVYILDDGRRPEFRDFAEQCGCGYIIRPDNFHAKAGNLNHAMRQTDSEFIAIFDCDHIPTRAFLQMTMGALVQDAKLAAIQTPHHFYSPDPFQRNLAAGERVPSEGNMFYGLLQDGNDFWNATFFCGSCAVIRRTALDSIGGFAVETVTEDAHTALRLHRNGWDTAYLRLPLAAGLATERLIMHIGQRVRWARGMLQILRVDNPLFGRGLSLGQRLCYLNAMGHFLFAIPRLVFLVAPLAFLLLGQNIIAASPLAIVVYAFPHIFHSVATNSRIQRNWRHSFWSEIYETVLALFLVRVTIVTLLRPSLGKFNVTDKGGVLESTYFDLRAVYPNIILAVVLGAGLGRGLFGMLFEQTTTLEFQALLLNSVWVIISLLTVLAAIAVGLEQRQPRLFARIQARLPVILRLPDGRVLSGNTRDISLSGCSLFSTEAGALAPEADIAVQFGDDDEEIIVPGKVLRWKQNSLQVLWEPQTLDQESKLVQAVFGRADAWADWNDYPNDRPLHSLWAVLVSIGALFRGKRSRSLDVMPVQSGGQAPHVAVAGRMEKKTDVLRPRRAETAGLAMLALMTGMSLWPAAARAQSSISQPPITRPVASGRSDPTVLPFAGQASTSAAAATDDALAPGSRRVTYTLNALGATAPMTMRGTSTIGGVMFGVRSDEVVTSAELVLSGATSPALIPEFSNVTVTLNEQYVGTIPANRSKPSFGPLHLRLDPVFFADSNRLNFRFTGRYTRECNDPLSGLLWSTVSNLSTLTLTLSRLPAHRDLASLPLPFFHHQIGMPLSLPVILPADPSNDMLRSAAIVTSWFGGLADFRGASFPVFNQAPPQGDAILIVPDGSMPELPLPPISGPTIAEIPNPNDPTATILVITGRDGNEVAAAATMLAIGSRTLSGSAMTVEAPSLQPRRAYDAPAWIPTDRPVRFGELVDASTLQGTGYVPGILHLPFRTSPDLYTWRDRPLETLLALRAPPGPIIDVAASRLDVGINGSYLRSFSLATPTRPWDWMKQWLSANPTTPRRRVWLPPYMVFSQNDLQFFFDARPIHRGSCGAIPEDLQMGIDPSSTIDLSRAYHFTQLPNLAFFAGSGFPFTRMADLSHTAVIVPEHPGTVELSAFLGLMGHLGALTGYPATHLAVARSGEAASVADRDLLMIGTLPALDNAAELLRDSPYRIDGTRLSVRLPGPLDGIFRLFDDTGPAGRRAAAASLSTPLGSEGAALIGAASPFGHGHSLVLLLARQPQALDHMVAALSDIGLQPHIQGDLTLMQADTVTSYRSGTTFTVGWLPFWLWPEWLLRDEPAADVALFLLGTAAVAVVLLRLVRRRAARRTGRGGKTE